MGAAAEPAGGRIATTGCPMGPLQRKSCHCPAGLWSLQAGFCVAVRARRYWSTARQLKLTELNPGVPLGSSFAVDML